MYPALLLLALDGVTDAERASVVGTFSSFFDLSQGLGAFIVRHGRRSFTGDRGAFAAGAIVRARRARRAARARSAQPRAPGRPRRVAPCRRCSSPTTSRPRSAASSRTSTSCGAGSRPARRPCSPRRTPGAAEWDAQQAFRVERARAAVLLPTPALARRIDALAREVGADVIFLDPMLPLGLRRAAARPPRRTSSSRTAPRSPATPRTPGSRGARRAGCCAARPASSRPGTYPARAGRARRRPARCRASSIPPGVDGERFRPLDADARAATRARFGLDPDRPLVLGVSRLVPRKGFDVVIDAVAGARPDVQLAIAGAGRDRAPARTPARAAAPTCGSSDACPTPTCPALYACADVFAMCCRDRWGGLEAEGFGIVFLEAAACGVPRSPGRSGGSHEAVVDGETGFVVAPRDVDAVRDAIARAARRRRAARRAWARRRAGARSTSSRTTGSSTRLAPVARGRPLGRRRSSAGSLGDRRVTGTADRRRVVGDARAVRRHDRPRRARCCTRSTTSPSVVSARAVPRVAADLDLRVRARGRALGTRRRHRASAACSSSRLGADRRAPAAARRARSVSIVVAVATAWANPFAVLVPMLPLGARRRCGARVTATFPARAASPPTREAQPEVPMTDTASERIRVEAPGRPLLRRRRRLRVVPRVGARREGSEDPRDRRRGPRASGSSSAPPRSARASATCSSTTTPTRRTRSRGSSSKATCCAASTARYRFEPDGPTSTRVHYDLAVELAVPLPGLVKRRAAGLIMGSALKELKKQVEAVA